MRRLAFLLAALLTSAARDAAAQVQVIPFPAPAPTPLPAPAPPAPAAPVVPAPSPVAAPTPTGCTAPLPALDLAAADLAAGADAYRALTQRTGAPSAYRYWKVSPAQVAATVRQACALGFAGYGTAPSGSLVTVLAARWPTPPSTRTATTPPPSSVTPSTVTPAPVVNPAPAAVSGATSPGSGAPVTSAPGTTSPAPLGPPVLMGPLGELLAGINAARAQGRRCGGTWQPAAPPLKVDIRLVAAA